MKGFDKLAIFFFWISILSGYKLLHENSIRKGTNLFAGMYYPFLWGTHINIDWFLLISWIHIHGGSYLDDDDIYIYFPFFWSTQYLYLCTLFLPFPMKTNINEHISLDLFLLTTNTTITPTIFNISYFFIHILINNIFIIFHLFQ